MIKIIRNSAPLILLLLISFTLSGCAGAVKNMRTVPLDQVVTGPEEGQSMIVFMRPSGMGFGIQSSVFEIDNTEPKLAGIVAAKKKVAYRIAPGNHLFMVVGESADFMSAELEANKTYYALVTPRMGMWKARFSLRPVHADELNTNQFNDWLKGSVWVEKSPDSDRWASENSTDIQDKYNKYYPAWMNKPSSERPMLMPNDGK